MSNEDPFVMPPPEPTASLWGGMMGSMPGIGPLLKLINDPQLGANARKAIQAIIEGQERIARIEEKLDRLLGVLGDGGAGRSGVTALLARVPNGAGADAASSVAVDDGSGGHAAAADQAGAAPGRDGDSGRALLAAGRHRGGV